MMYLMISFVALVVLCITIYYIVNGTVFARRMIYAFYALVTVLEVVLL